MTRLLLILAAAATLLVASLLGGVLREARADAPRTLESAQLAKRGLELQERARRSSDPALYAAAETALREALRLDEDNAAAVRGLAALAGSRHRFHEMLTLARRALALEPESADVHGLLGDALLELGRYREAFAAFDRLAALKPNVSAYARVSYARELRGDLAGALKAIELAIDSAAPGEPSALMRTLAGNLLLADRRLEDASTRYREALAFVPGYAPALSGLGDVAAARGKHGTALSLYRRAADGSAAPEFAATLGDALDLLGRPADAARAWSRAEALEAQFARNGGDNRLETAEFDLNHDRDLAGALGRARAGRAARPSVEGDHVLAWALYRNGRCAEARAVSLRSLRLGTLDVDGFYHHSLIEKCLGNDGAAAAYLDRVRALKPWYPDTARP
ncbi:MAG TPA: tetratricopeptide repeat protein [Gaiellaceae bacterium]|nr:tetratricopeptide repeat protein [Gaiellaceae bacterium]